MGVHSTMATMEQLPYELLSYIFDQPHVPNEILFSISFVSKRLHYFALPIYLARFKIHDPTDFAEVVLRDTPQGTVDALSGLRVALFVSSIKRLVCRFEITPDPAEYRVVLHHMRRVYGLVSALTVVEDVKFILGNDQCGCCSAFTPGDVLDAALLEWSTTVGRTWSKIIEKKCTSLSIIGGRYMGHTYSFNAGMNVGKHNGTFEGFKRMLTKKRSNSTLRPEGATIDMLHGKHWRFRRVAGTGTEIVLTPLYSPAADHAVIRSLTINSMILMVPPLLHWVVALLRLPSIETLHIMNLSVNRKCWHAVLSIIAKNAPHLTGIRLSCVRQLLPTDLLHFLSRLANLETLHLGRDVDCIDTFDLGPFPDFPHLKSLHAPAGWVFKLLSAQRKGLSSLRKLAIVYNMRNDGLSHWVRRSSMPSIPNLLKEQQRSLSISLRIHLGKNPGWRMTEDVENAIDDGLEHDQPELGDVSSLTLVFDEVLDTDDISLASILPKWLSLFFGLRYLAIRTRPSLEASQSTDDAVTSLIMEILKDGDLAEISSVEVNGVKITSSGTTKEDDLQIS